MKAILSARLTLIDFVYDILFRLVDLLEERREKVWSAWSASRV